ncbi:MAG: EAL domain-containing protein [Thiobacillus sp.]|uniref:EAL domain-containing protein n=1 Tax=unclassified Thiobacillus TaxID=2646513 RepID=UPI00086C6E0D|nr:MULTISPECIES: EAL domain-containing protein [unclassified Thiobacillus]MBN8770571.1 EAL domain-containing protein [Thiobacillus sp.]MBN8780535.1 EAL domain-containing protein [Thiobacillus sp.]ODV04630.1 MAG: diguanylate cyclase [Thiobacillus sp. SCN 63-57]OJY57705.1 MAG: diguanylate cyclase [Thiobacillus sp. 0-1251]
MARIATPLTDRRIRQTHPTAKPLKLADGGGMYLLLNPDGSRYWRLDYRFGGKRKTLALGVYPEVTLGEARRRRCAARALLAEGRDPAAERKAGKAGKPLPDGSEQAYALALLGEGVWDWNLRSGRVRHNPQWARLMGLDVQQTEHTWQEAIACLQEQDRAGVMSAIRACLDGNAVFDREHRIRHADGTSIWLHNRGEVVERDAEGNPLRMVGSLREVTELRREALAMRQRNLLLQIIAAVNEMLVAERPEHELMARICQELVRDDLFRMAWVGLVNEDGVTVDSVAEAGFENTYLSKVEIRCDDSPQGQGPTGTAIRLGITAINDDTETNQQFAPWRERALLHGYRSSAATPLRAYGRIIGALTVYSEEPHAFGPEKVILLEKLAADLGVVMGHRAALAALRESEERFRLLLDASPEAIFGVDSQGICTFVNPACLDMLGYTQAEVLGKSIHALIHHSYPDGRPYPKEQCHIRSSTLEGKPTHVDSEVHWRKDGTSFPVEYWSHPMYHNGQLVGAVVNFIDISERKRMEQALRESEERYRLISSVSTDLLYSCMQTADGDLIIDWATTSADQVFGYSLDEIMAKGCWRHLVHPDDFAEFDRNIAYLAPGQRSECELRILAKDGAVHYIRAYTLAMEAADDQAGNRLYGACQDITERRQAEARIEFLAHHDVLTGLPNRVLLRDRFEQALARAQRSQKLVAMLFLDLDNFKRVNDTLGHVAGDQLLLEAVKRLTHSTRDSDTISRQGGDEFILLLNEIPDMETVERVAADILRLLAEPVEINGHAMNASCSIGIAMYPQDGSDFDSLLQKADTAMYNAKDAGRNTYRFFDDRMNRQAREHLMLQNRLHQALYRAELQLHYQPQLDADSGKVTGVEALLRWNNPELGDISPARFIPVAEDSGLIVPIGAWVIEQSCRQAQTWRQAGLPDIIMSVNLSALQFRRAGLIETVAGALARSGLPPHLLELELTESILLQDVENTLDTVRQLKALGIRLAIDDFGTGYSSLSYLKRFAVDRLKIDQSFVRDIHTDPDDAAIVSAIIQLARSLRLGIIAEGVETAEQLAFLREAGCSEVQGYLFSRPLAPAAMDAFLRMP